jgi:hypothetical protein
MRTITGADAPKFVVMIYKTMGDGALYLGEKGYGKPEDATLFPGPDMDAARAAAKAMPVPPGFPLQGFMKADELCKALGRIQKSPDFVRG